MIKIYKNIVPQLQKIISQRPRISNVCWLYNITRIALQPANIGDGGTLAELKASRKRPNRPYDVVRRMTTKGPDL